MKKISQRGSVALTIVLLVVVVILAGGFAYWKMKNNSDVYVEKVSTDTQPVLENNNTTTPSRPLTGMWKSDDDMYIEFTGNNETCVGGDSDYGKGGKCLRWAPFTVIDNKIIVQDPDVQGPEWHYLWSIDSKNDLTLAVEVLNPETKKWETMMTTKYKKVQ